MVGAAPGGLALELAGFMAAQRVLELLLSAANARRLRAMGAVEAGREHYRWIVGLHAAFLLSLATEGAASRPPAAWPWALALFALAQALRYWAIAALGRRWTTRVWVLPGAPLVRRGPYRILRHPNYVAVMAEFVAAPLAAGAYLTLLVFAPLNAWLLWRVRIPAEEAALDG